MKKQESTVDKDIQKMGAFARMCLSFGLAIVMLSIPTLIHTDIDIINIARGTTMFFGFLFLIYSFARLWDMITGRPLLPNKEARRILGEDGE